MGELRSVSFVPVEKLLSNISRAFPQTHSKKYKERLSVMNSERLLSSGCKSCGGFLAACQLLKFWECCRCGEMLLIGEFGFYYVAVVERCTEWASPRKAGLTLELFESGMRWRCCQ